MLPTDLQQEIKRRGEILKNARAAKKISLNQLTRMSGISRQCIREIEEGKSSWRIDTEIILMQALGILPMPGSIEIDQTGNKITSLKISGVILINSSLPA